VDGGHDRRDHFTGSNPTADRRTRRLAASGKLRKMTVDEAIRLWASCYAFVDAGAHARLTLPQAAADIVWRDSIPAPADYWTLVESGRGSGFADIAQGN